LGTPPHKSYLTMFSTLAQPAKKTCYVRRSAGIPAAFSIIHCPGPYCNLSLLRCHRTITLSPC